jgi:hypothetical protein
MTRAPHLQQSRRFIRHALRAGFSIEEIFDLTKIKEIVDFEEELAGTKN